MLDHTVKTHVAWNSAKLIVREYRGGEENFWERIGKMDRGRLHEFMKSGNGGKALHFHHGKMTDNLRCVAELMLCEYGGTPRNIWRTEKNDVGEVKRRFREFHSIGEQLASMAVMILVCDYGELGGEESFRCLVPKEDVHTKRVFRRAGLTDGKQTVVDIAKELNPNAEGALRTKEEMSPFFLMSE